MTAAQTTTTSELERERDRLDKAEVVLGYRFADRRWLLTALTHRSWLNEHATKLDHNEVLELLGDAVLSVIVVNDLVVSSPAAGEGELTERRAAHVSAEALAPAAWRAGLVPLLRAGRGVIANGVPANLAADVVEAVIGAIWRDAGDNKLVACTALVARLLGPPPKTATATAAHGKRVLQERLQRLFGRAPDYRIERLDGPNHAPSFRADVVFAGHVLGSGIGGNKRTATEAAALTAVAALEAVDDDALCERLQ